MRLMAVLMLLLPLAGCYPAFHDIGPAPPMTPPMIDASGAAIIEEPEPPVVAMQARYNMDSTSTWNDAGGQMFRDARAFKVGDILTIRISMNDRAELLNRSRRDSSAEGEINGEAELKIDDINPVQSIGASGDISGKIARGGSVNRAERIELSIAASVLRASPNGNLLIAGTQEVRVNTELRLLTVEGVVRTRDILPDNTIPYDKIAEARISYGGLNSRTAPVVPISALAPNVISK
jgi:flagellar L-ring protein precursor FlgH